MQKDPSNLWFYERWLIKILKTGHLPKHLAFIMDGNRRYAKDKNKPKAYGHEQGLNSLKKCLEWCLNLGIETVSVFAFAIENFNREKSEVETLFKLAKVNLYEMAQNNNFLQKHSIKVNIVGDLSLLPEDVRSSMCEIMKLTEKNEKMNLNICFSYNSTFEMQHALDSLKEDYDKGLIKPDDITPKMLNEKFLIKGEPDMVIRTSNEIRLSNFMLFQSNNSELMFLKENWPELSFWSFLKIILTFQLNEKSSKFYQKYLKEKEDCFALNNSKTN